MLTKLAALFITLILCIAIGVVVSATMLIAMNGYSESDAMWGIGTFVVLAILVSVLCGLGSFFSAGYFTKKKYGPVVSSLLAIVAFTVIGALFEIISAFIGIGISEFVRVNY